jgi:hypothetical protein
VKEARLERAQRIVSKFFRTLDKKLRIPSWDERQQQVKRLIGRDPSPSFFGNDMENFAQPSRGRALPLPLVDNHVLISGVKLDLSPDKWEISDKETFLWLTAEIVADVDMEGGLVAQRDDPLEVVILLDISSVFHLSLDNAFLTCR